MANKGHLKGFIYSIVVVIIFFCFSGSLNIGQAREGNLSEPYPAPREITPNIILAYPGPGEGLTGEPVRLEGSYQTEIDGQTIIVHERDGARRQDAKEYAKHFGVSLEEALYRLDFQEEIGRLGAELIEKETTTYAGMWIQHEPDYKVILQFTNRGNQTIQQYIFGSPLAKIIEVREASHSLKDLVDYQDFLVKTLNAYGFKYSLEVNEVENKLLLLVPDTHGIETALTKARISLPDFVEVSVGESIIATQATIYGGLDSVNICTIPPNTITTVGYNLYSWLSPTEREFYATTAAHACEDDDGSMIVNGYVLPFVQEIFDSYHDFQWHLIDDGSKAKPWIKDGMDNLYINSYRVINRITPRIEQRIGEWVCKWGTETELTCGIIESTSKSVWGGNTWIYVDGGAVNLSEGGDSGGPWFSYDRAYGIHTGELNEPLKAFYMPIDLVSDFPFLQVYTSESTASNYFPDLRNHHDGWTSSIYIRNDASVTKDIRVYYYNQNGTRRTIYDAYSMSPNTRVWIPVDQYERIAVNGRGTAYVTGDRDVSAYVVQYHESPEAWAAYSGVTTPDSEVHVPLLYRNDSWDLYSQLFIRNNGAVTTKVSVQFRANNGYDYNRSITLGPGAVGVISLIDQTQLGSNFYGSARIYNDQNNLLSVAATVYKTDNSSMSESSYTGGQSAYEYAPLVQNYNYNWISGSSIQNASNNSSNVNMSYYSNDGIDCSSMANPNLEMYHSWVFSSPPGNPPCSSVASAVLSREDFEDGYLTGVVNQVLPGTGNSADYTLIANPSKEVTIPFWHNGMNGWTSGLVIQNVTNELIHGTIYYYWSTIGEHSNTSFTLAPHSIHIVANQPGAISGSVKIIATGPVAVVTTYSMGGVSDGSMSTEANHR